MVKITHYIPLNLDTGLFLFMVEIVFFWKTDTDLPPSLRQLFVTDLFFCHRYSNCSCGQVLTCARACGLSLGPAVRNSHVYRLCDSHVPSQTALALLLTFCCRAERRGGHTMLSCGRSLENMAHGLASERC